MPITFSRETAGTDFEKQHGRQLPSAHFPCNYTPTTNYDGPRPTHRRRKSTVELNGTIRCVSILSTAITDGMLTMEAATGYLTVDQNHPLRLGPNAQKHAMRLLERCFTEIEA